VIAIAIKADFLLFFLMRNTEMKKGRQKMSVLSSLRLDNCNTMSKVKLNIMWDINSSIGDEVLKRMMWHELLVELTLISVKYV